MRVVGVRLGVRGVGVSLGVEEKGTQNPLITKCDGLGLGLRLRGHPEPVGHHLPGVGVEEKVHVFSKTIVYKSLSEI